MPIPEFSYLPQSEEEVTVFWFRRDLRLHDNHGFWKALSKGKKVLPVFIFDTDIIDKLEDKDDKRISFIYDALSEMDGELRKFGSALVTAIGKPIEVIEYLVNNLSVKDFFANEDYEPYARKRDEAVHDFLKHKGVAFHLHTDHLILRPGEVLKDDGNPYSVFTPFSRKWKEIHRNSGMETYPSEERFKTCFQMKAKQIHEPADLGFKYTTYRVGDKLPAQDLLTEYANTRNIPALDATSRIGPHLRFGTISIRNMVRLAEQHSEAWLNELIWRDFFMHILWYHPRVETEAFKKQYDNIPWRNDMQDFERWKSGVTGYPIVDAGMRELAESGFMHNRVRMITASFLVKHLLIDWRLGEAWFARKLLDFELSSNNGNWQWAAGSGCDAAPYFRIFNPWSQQKKFDPDARYIRKYVPEYGTSSYPEPMIEHSLARERCLKTYKSALDK